LKSAEIMKAAVTHLEPHLDKVEGLARGTIVLATVRGDVHDIGKNLVDIILTNNGYRVVNLGIKQPIADIISAAEEVGADAIGMSGLLVKSTQIMRENLEELNAKGLAARYPVLLGGAALTRDYVEGDLSRVYSGQVRYARDAFEGLALMDAVMAHKDSPVALPSSQPRPPRTPKKVSAAVNRSAVTRPIPGGVDIPRLPFSGVRQSSTNLDEVLPWLNTKTLFTAQWGLDKSEAESRLAHWVDIAHRENLMDFRVAWGYWPCYSSGERLIIPGEGEFIFPRQSDGEFLCLADYFRNEDETDLYGPDIVGFQVVTVGERASHRTAELFADDEYRDYFELHGLSVQLAEACAAMWHNHMRAELNLNPSDSGQRYSFGYPACPDLDQRSLMMRLLKPEMIGVTISEEFQLHPEQSTDAMIVHHRDARYFSVRP